MMKEGEGVGEIKREKNVHAHSDVAENVRSLVRREYARQHLPRMQHRITYT